MVGIIHIFNSFHIIFQQLMAELHLSAARKTTDSASSDDYNRSTVKRLFSSVFSIIDGDHDISHFNEQEQGSPIERLLQNCAFLTQLDQKMRADGLYEGYKLPILCLSLEEQPNRYEQTRYQGAAALRMQLDQRDIQSLASRFGRFNQVIATSDKREAYIFFDHIANAFICLKVLRSIKLRAGSSQFRIDWVHNNGYHPEVTNEIHNFVLAHHPVAPQKEPRTTDFPEEIAASSAKQNKFTCRYDIQIENEREFQVARRIIGPKGCNMKRIIQQSVPIELKASDSVNELLKLRLRGRGSGYKEGPEQQESNESLHLCVSAKDESVYSQACLKVEKLLCAIYLQYADFMRKQGKLVELVIKKILLGQSPVNSEEGTGFSFGMGYRSDFDSLAEADTQQELYRISPQKIAELLELRNKARRELNFGQADRIRNYLRSLGVCLIDEKGRRGKAAQVTTWKYIY